MSKGLGWLAIGFAVFLILAFPTEAAPLFRGFFGAVWVGFQQFVLFLDAAVPEPPPPTVTVPAPEAPPTTDAFVPGGSGG